MSAPDLPDGGALEQAIAGLEAGALSTEAFAAALADATLIVVVARGEDEEGAPVAQPLVARYEDEPYGIAFTSARQWSALADEAEFVLLAGADVLSSWPATLGLAINPSGSPTLLLRAEQVAGLS